MHATGYTLREATVDEVQAHFAPQLPAELQQAPRDLLQRTLGRRDYTVHGFRSSFREWAARTGQKREASEAALSHDVRSAVEAAYWRDDLLEERFPIMQEWADYLDGGADA